MKKNKKSQVLVFSAMFLILLLLITYSIETRNSYKSYSSKSTIIENIKYESCQVGINSNGSFIDDRFSFFSGNLSQYCLEFDLNCTVSIVKKGDAPSNLSLLNYTHYDFNISFESQNFNYSNAYNC